MENIEGYIRKFTLSQEEGECISTLTIEMPADSIQMPADFWADLEIKRTDVKNGN